MSKKQIVWHAYHAGSLCQLVDLEARRVQIEQIKPEHELPTRRRLLKPVLGQLPAEFIVAAEIYDKARKAWKTAWEKSWEKSWEQAWEVYKKARKEAWRAREAYKKAREKARDEIERLHAVECPDCPWDGETIFPVK